ncbi:uncharacterized protein LOC117916947 [Vitis riparia]|uniref:uncharacterized protein LOC117916947 n=1 Tax=Vitis riparia TaxID=96939 RepID=UPI00155A405A|nr:uncharacterized protein LOC117916947 [Vitis riparia]
MTAPSCIVPPSEQMIIRPYLVPLLLQFHGMENENPYTHIKDFEEVCHTFQEGVASIDLMRLKLFPFTLKDKVKVWLNSWRPRSIRSWPELQAEFLKKFFPAPRMSPAMKQLLETMCGGDFMSKSPDEALDFLNYVAEISRSWDEPHGKDSSKVKPQNNAKGGMYTLNKDVDVQVKMATLSRRLEELEARGANEIKVVNDVPMQIAQCSICQSGEHLVSECPTILAVREMFMEQANIVNEDDGPKQDEIVNEEVKKKDKLLSPPFPKALRSRKVVNNATEIFEVLKQVKVNIPLLDMIKQVPPYAKFLKDLCTMKRGLNINKKAFLTEQVSAIIQCKTPIKYKDPGYPTISVNIGDTYVEKALLDLGASVNLLPYSVYKQLGLGELKPTSITLSLADRSIKIPRGMIEDVLVQVDKFYYPVDFIVLDTEPIAREPNHVPIILGRPFLATKNALINCRNEVMQLTFGNMTLELNIFHLCKRHPNQDEDEQEEACLIDTLIEEHVEGIREEEMEKAYEEFEEIEQEEKIEEANEITSINHPMQWKAKEKPLSLTNDEEEKKEESPKLNLKPLPTDLKYAYLEEDKFPVAISSKLSYQQKLACWKF